MISELPGDVKRRVLSCSFPHLYKCMQKNPLLLEFVEHIVEQSQNMQYTAIVLIDFIANHLEVSAAESSDLQDLGTDPNEQPILLCLFRIVVKRISSTVGEEFLLKPYMQVGAEKRLNGSAF